MISLLEMISGWVMVVLFAVSVLYPLCMLLQKLLGMYLKNVSEGRINEIKVLPWFSESFMYDSYDRFATLSLRYYLLLLIYSASTVFFLGVSAALTSHRVENDFFLEWSTLIFNFWYGVGTFLAAPLVLAGILYGLHKVLRLVFKLQLIASNALQAVKDHENNMHKGE